MPGRFMILFIICIILLVASEYLLLVEAYAEKRTSIILVAGLGLVGSIILFLLIYNKFRKTVK